MHQNAGTGTWVRRGSSWDEAHSEENTKREDLISKPEKVFEREISRVNYARNQATGHGGRSNRSSGGASARDGAAAAAGGGGGAAAELGAALAALAEEQAAAEEEGLYAV